MRRRALRCFHAYITTLAAEGGEQDLDHVPKLETTTRACHSTLDGEKNLSPVIQENEPSVGFDVEQESEPKKR